MKPTLTTIAALSILAMLAGSVKAMPIIAQTQPTAKTTTISQASEQLNLPLLSQALSSFLQSDRYQTESQIQLKAVAQGTEVTTNLQVKTTAQSGKKFRAEIQITQPGEEAKPANLVVSNGKQVWIYRPDLQQYAVTTFEKFSESGEWIFMSTSSFAFVNFPEEDRQNIANRKLSDNSVLAYLNLSNNGTFKGDERTVDGESFYVYSYTDTKEALTFSGFVQPETATLKQVQIASKSEGFDILITEKINNRIANPPITANTFKFSPPKGAKLVKSLSLNPF